MTFRDASTLLTGRPGPLRESLAEHLVSLGARIVSGADGQAQGEVEYLFHVWSSPERTRFSAPATGWYEEAVAAPVLVAARLAGGLRHICLVSPEDSSVAARVLEEALGYLARQRKIPFAVLRLTAGAEAGRLPAVAAFVASAGVAGRIDVAGGR